MKSEKQTSFLVMFKLIKLSENNTINILLYWSLRYRDILNTHIINEL